MIRTKVVEMLNFNAALKNLLSAARRVSRFRLLLLVVLLGLGAFVVGCNLWLL